MNKNEELLRAGYEAFAKGDMETLSALFADDVKWHVGGRNQLSGDYIGKDAVFDFFSKLITLSEGTFELEVHDIVANDEHAIVMTTSRARRGEKVHEGTGVAVYHANGRQVTEAWFLAEDPYALDEFWG